MLAAWARNSAVTTLYLATILTTTASPQAPAPPEAPRTTSEQVATFETSVAPRPDEDIAEACRYEVTLTTPVSRAKHLPGQLSGGQQQRVAVARAVAGEPALLLADEPTGNLDSKSGESVMELLQELHHAGATICMVTHDPRYAAHAKRHIHLFDGRVVTEPSEVTTV
jgi:putative ABC transport system ATP-binding protein